MSEASTSHHDPLSAPDGARGRLRVVLVGETGLDGRFSPDPEIETVRARTAIEAVGEIAAPAAPAERTVLVVGADAEPNGALPAFLDAVRKADPTVRVARAVGDALRESRQGYDGVVTASSAVRELRRLAGLDEPDRASTAAEVKPVPDAPAAPTPDADPDAEPAGDARLAPAPSAPSEPGTPAPERFEPKQAGPTAPGPIEPEPIEPEPMKPEPAKPRPGSVPAIGEAKPASRPGRIEQTADDPPRAVGRAPAAIEPALPARAAGAPAGAPPGAIGDGALLPLLEGTRSRLLAAAIRLIATRIGADDVNFLDATESDADTDPVPAVPVSCGGKRLGTLRAASVQAERLVPHASWLGSWLAQHERQQALRRAAFTDPLTGAWNRRYFDGFLEAALERARENRRTVTVLVFDIDEFKRYNDDYGHPAGDEILIEVVRALKGSVRPSDRVCRIGGDEFAVVFDDPAGPRVRGSRPPESVYVLAKRVQRQIGEKKFPKLGADAPGSLTISGGLAAFPWDGHDAETLLDKADQLALESKRLGKNAISLGPGAERVCKHDGDDLID
jgi:two-component system cell cycle response regulator